MNDFLYEGPDGELYHWGIKKGEAKQDHKYIRREWKNGRWTYVYKENLSSMFDKITGKSARAELRVAKKQYDDTTFLKRVTNGKYNPTVEDMRRSIGKDMKDKYDSGRLDSSLAGRAAQGNLSDFHKQEAKEASARRRYEIAKQNYDKTLPAKIDKATKPIRDKLEKGKNAVSIKVDDSVEFVTGKGHKRALDKAKKDYDIEVKTNRSYGDKTSVQEQIAKDKFDRIYYDYYNYTLPGLAKSKIRKGAQWVLDRVS